jgi:hypothetical protein
MKLGEAYVDLRVNDASLKRGMEAARADANRTARAMEKTGKATAGLFRLDLLGKAFNAFEKVLRVLEKTAKQTKDGEWAVKDYELAIGGLVNSMLGLVNLDAVSFFRVLEGAIKSVTRGTMESQHLFQSWRVTLLDVAAAVKFFKGDVEGVLEIAKQRNAAQEEARRLQNEMTKDQQKQADERIQSMEKEKRATARISTDLAGIRDAAQEKFSGRSHIQQQRAVERDRMLREQENAPRPADKDALRAIGQHLMGQARDDAANAQRLSGKMVEALATQDPSMLSGADRASFDNLVGRLAEQRRGGAPMTPRELVEFATGGPKALPPPTGQLPAIRGESFNEWKSRKVMEEMLGALTKIVGNTDDMSGKFSR